MNAWLPLPLQRPGRIAVYAARGLGDGLLSMMLAYQLSLLGHEAVLYSSVLLSMQNWAPHVAIKKFPEYPDLENELASYDHVIAADHTPISRLMDPHDKLTILYQKHFDRSRTMVDNLVNYLQKVWNPHASAQTGLRSPVSLNHRAHRQRVVIHPTSGEPEKNWYAGKFMRLARHLRMEDYEPVFMVSPDEAQVWSWVRTNNFRLIAQPTIDEMARYIYESGYLIGNDSGAGHLASLLLVPTLSLFARASYSRLWRPGWGPGLVATPQISLPGARLKQQFWKDLLTVGHVLRTFRRLHERTSA